MSGERSAYPFAEAVLGQTDEHYIVTSFEEMMEAVKVLVSQARRQISLWTYDLAPNVFAGTQCFDVFSQSIRQHRSIHCRILAQELRSAIAKRHPLVELSRKLTSYVHILLLDKVDRTDNQEMALLVDDRGLLWMADSREPRAVLYFNQPYKVLPLSERFNAAFNRGHSDPNIRRLGI